LPERDAFPQFRPARKSKSPKKYVPRHLLLSKIGLMGSWGAHPLRILKPFRLSAGVQDKIFCAAGAKSS